MKKMFFAAIAAVTLVLTSCGGGSTSPKVFNETLINSFQAANNVLDEYDAAITASVKADELANINVAADEALAKVDAEIEKVNKLNAKGGDEYKSTILTCLDTVKEIIETGKKYAALEEGYSASEFHDLEKEYNAKRMQLSGELQDVATAAADYAKTVSGQ